MLPYQPYRRTNERPNTPALQAMLLGRPMILPNPIDQYRLMMQKRPQGLAALLQLRR